MVDLAGFEAALKAWLQGDTPIAAIVGTGIAPLPVPEGSPKPVISYEISGVLPQTTLDGDDDGLLGIHVQIDSWARKHDDALALGELVRARMVSSPFKAVPEDETDNGRSLYEYETKLHRFHWRFICWYS